jgi:hypothetical protein
VQDGDKIGAFIVREVDMAGDMPEEKGMGVGIGKGLVHAGDYFGIILISSPGPL